MTGTRWFRLAPGIVLVSAPAWVMLSNLDPIWHGHPAYPTTLLICVAIGLTLVAFALWPWRADPEPDGPPWAREDEAARSAGPADPAAAPAWPAHRPRRHLTRIVTRTALSVAVVLIVGTLVWLRPFGAGPAAIAATASGGGVSVTDQPTRIELAPSDSTGAAPPRRGLVFTPGARVDPRAYAQLLRPVAAAGHLVVILKPPFGLGIVQAGQAGTAIEDHPEVGSWVVGGHSLGGVVAAGFAADDPDLVDGLLLYASYPNGDLSRLPALSVRSVWGSNDGLTLPSDIDASRANLPADADFPEVVGGVHAFFGDYGEQPGDGEPGVSRKQATAQITAATVDFMKRLPTG